MGNQLNLYHNLSICFDLDGTIIDTAPDLVRVLNEVIAEDGLAPVEFNRSRNLVGFGAKRLIRDAFETQGRSLSDERLNKLFPMFLDLYEKDIAQLSRPFPDVLRTLKTLKANGAQLSICTNKPGYLARPLVNALKMSHLFDKIIGSGDGTPTKPNAEHIYAAVGHRHRNNIVMVGDSLPDILAARAADVPVILMAYGYANTPLARLRADRTLRNFRDLPAAIEYVGLKRFRQNFQSS